MSYQKLARLRSNNLIDIINMDQQLYYSPKKMDIKKTLDLINLTLSSKMRDKRLSITHNISVSCNDPIIADPLRIQQIYLNLLSNAIEGSIRRQEIKVSVELLEIDRGDNRLD